MRVSLNEIETTVLKAARGAGYTWGLAEDVARAARWMAAQDLPWLEAAPFALAGTTVGLIASGRPLENPIAAGAYFADLGLPAVATVLPRIPAPLWLAGLIGCGTGTSGESMSAAWLAEGRRCRIEVEAGRLRLAEGPLAAPVGETVTLLRLESDPGRERAPDGPPAVYDADERLWAMLAELEKRTCVPASELSRREGAGAGLVDND